MNGVDIMIPTIKFRKMTLQENIDVIKWAYYECNGVLSVHDYTIQYFSQLADLDKNASKEDVYKKIEEVVTEDYKNIVKKLKVKQKDTIIFGKIIMTNILICYQLILVLNGQMLMLLRQLWD